MFIVDNKPASATTTNFSSLYFSLNVSITVSSYGLQIYFLQRVHKPMDILPYLPEVLRQSAAADVYHLLKILSGENRLHLPLQNTKWLHHKIQWKYNCLIFLMCAGNLSAEPIASVGFVAYLSSDTLFLRLL